MPERIFKAAHDTCKPALTQTPSHLFSLSPSHISLYHPFLLFPIEPHNLDPEKDHRLGENRNSEQRLFEREQEPGAEAGMRQVFCVYVCVCVRALKVHTYAVCTVSDVCFLHQWSCCCRGWCSAVLFRAAADARPICLDTLAQLLAFCCSTDGEAWRNIGES